MDRRAVVYEAVARWAADDLRSVNAQIEYALRRALKKAGRPVRPPAVVPAAAEAPPHDPAPVEEPEGEN